MMGLTFHLFPVEGKTKIVYNKKFIEINMNINELSQCWFNWQMRGQYIQDAFRELSNAEREFILTGITPDEWNELPF